MNDIHNELFTDIATPVRATFPGTYCTGERLAIPPRFPCVVVVEADSYEDARGVDNTLRENLTALLYEITVFSNKSNGKRSECVEILEVIDGIMRRKNALRFSKIEGYFDTESTIYMVQARYRLKTDGTYTYTF